MRPPDQPGLQLGDAVRKPHRRWKACWGKLHCFMSSSPKGDSRRRPHLLPAASSSSSASAANPSSILNAQIAPESKLSSSSLSPVVHAPPSSPASFCYAENLPSPAAILSLFPLNCMDDLCSNATPRCDSSFRRLDPVLVTPPLHSALTTEPTTPLSTAPFTPPPELAHLTTPPSPELPFAELIPSSFGVKCEERIHRQVSSSGAFMDSADAEFESEDRSGNTTSSSKPNTSDDVLFPVPERVSSLQDDTIAASGISIFKRSTSFGFNQTSFAHSCEESSPELIFEQTQHDEEIWQEHDEKISRLHAETALLNLHSNVLYMEEHPQNHDLQQTAVEPSLQPRNEQHQTLQMSNVGGQKSQKEVTGSFGPFKWQH